MTAEYDALESLAKSGLRAALEWAAPIAFARTGNDFDDDAGHDQMVVGVHNFVYLRDLLDRATSNGRYELDPEAPNQGADMLGRGISATAFATMPTIEPAAIARKNFKQSPGWASDGHRVLLSSYKLGGIDRINWGSRSQAKKDVADQHFVGGLTLFSDEDFGLETISGIPDDDEFDGVTLVAGHAYDPTTGQFELYIGQSKNSAYRGDSCWHWRTPLLTGGPPETDAKADPIAPVTGDPDSSASAEIDVKLRERHGEGESELNG